MHITMPVMNGLEATSEIVKGNPESKVLILTMHEHPGIRVTIKHSGAKGMVTKSRAMEEITQALKTIIAAKPTSTKPLSSPQ